MYIYIYIYAYIYIHIYIYIYVYICLVDIVFYLCFVALGHLCVRCLYREKIMCRKNILCRLLLYFMALGNLCVRALSTSLRLFSSSLLPTTFYIFTTYYILCSRKFVCACAQYISKALLVALPTDILHLYYLLHSASVLPTTFYIFTTYFLLRCQQTFYIHPSIECLHINAHARTHTHTHTHIHQMGDRYSAANA